MASLLSLHEVAFEFPNGTQLFSDLNFAISAGTTALVGPNGVGKTTLARLLCGDLNPTRGRIQRQGTVRLLPQRQIAPVVSVDDYLSDYEWSSVGDELLDGIDRSAKCSALSGGQWMRVRLAKFLDEGLLILDEPSNDLDRSGREAVLNFLRSHRGGTLLISHDREALEICDDFLELSAQGLTKFGGGWEAYLTARNLERVNLANALEGAKRARENAREERNEQVERQAKRNRQGAARAARGGIPKILLGGRKRRAQVTTGKVDSATLKRTEGTVTDAHRAYEANKVGPVMYVDLLGTALPAKKLVAEATRFNVRFGDWIYASDLNFSWRGNARVAIRGANGTGKTTLLAAILGKKFETRGELRRGSLATLYVDQRGTALDDKLTLIENLRAETGRSETEVRNGLAKFLFSREAVFRKVIELSGGERLRATLALRFLSEQKPELLILDEPTNNLDLVNVEFLENLVAQFPGAVIAVSHDDRFITNCRISEELRLV